MKNKYLILKKQLAGFNSGKHIYPKNMENFDCVNNYSELIKIVDSYLIKNSNKLNNLWLIIGATNNNDNDLSRFSEKYDISINLLDDEVNVKETELLTLSDADFYLYNKKHKGLYDYLIDYLSNKFSKIIFDWSVTQFINLFNLIPKLLLLLQPDGELYINTFKNPVKQLNIFKKESDKYYLYSIQNIKINLKKEIKEFSNYDSNKKVVIYTNFIFNEVFNLIELSKYVDDIDFGIPIDILDKHLEKNDENKIIDDKYYIDQIIEKCSSIIDYTKYNINYINDDYPNESNDNKTDIFGYFMIKKI